MTNQENLDAIGRNRIEIDRIDRQIVRLLNERCARSLAIRDLKSTEHLGIFDARREEEILEKTAEANEGPLDDEHVHAVYAAILRVMKEA
ncbi:chorismate mutase [Gordonibacter sp. Marseille-P4307]|uniref:chorismate mutase n=1 Tax=Gordonibacter sp. Marseille-P4307 TaxID=2161815 RepID=UPI000F533522|nr:chorismate mutase [Gordonibacter sp. Marseille-P4307]